MTEAIIAGVALAVGLGLGWFFWGIRLNAASDELRSEAVRRSVAEASASRVADLESRLHQSDRGLSEAAASVAALEARLQDARAAGDAESARSRSLQEQYQAQGRELVLQRERIAELTTQLAAANKQAEEKIALLLEAKQTLADQFQNLANSIFEDKGSKFVAQNKQQLEAILKPLSDGLGQFKARVDEVYDKESKERFSLQNEIKRLADLNSKIGEDAINLTNALKGHGKTQGNWGELVLERVLESSGLQKGREYEAQVGYEGDEGNKRQYPDVVIKLPEGKNIVVDSKVSLTAYEEYCSAGTEEEQTEALRRHIQSVRGHLDELSEKNYQTLYGIRSLDFVLMFMPIEPAFMLAVQADQKLYADAFKKNVMIVGPWNLLISLKTIASIWRYEYQNRNAQELVRQCTALYEKFVGFVKDVDDIGSKIKSAQGSYEAAIGKLSSGKGNLVRQVERIRQLGLKPGKSLPDALVEAAELGAAEEEDAPPGSS